MVGKLVGRLRRNGIDVVTATMPYKQQASSADELDALGFRTNINVKEIFSVDGGVTRQLTAREFDDVVVHEVWRGPGTVADLSRPALRQYPSYVWWNGSGLYGRVLEELR